MPVDLTGIYLVLCLEAAVSGASFFCYRDVEAAAPVLRGNRN